MKLIATDPVQIEFAPEDTEAAIALALLEVIREKGNGTKNSDVVLFKDVASVLSEMIADGQLIVAAQLATPNGNGDTHAADDGVTYEETPLTMSAKDTLTLLINENKPEGMTPAEVGEILDIDNRTAQARLRTLTATGYVERVARGHYRAIDDD